jgi:hypothetical protein
MHVTQCLTLVFLSASRFNTVVVSLTTLRLRARAVADDGRQAFFFLFFTFI